MDFKRHFFSIRDFLAPYKNIWFQETLNLYPNTLAHFPVEWISNLEKLNSDELYAIESQRDNSSLKGTALYKFFEEMDKITKLPHSNGPDDLDLPDWAFNRVNYKKRHEIAKIRFEVKQIQQTVNFNRTVDIGGGQGHLSRILAHYEQIPAWTIDMSKEFQEIGKKRVKKFPLPENAEELKFVNLKFGEDTHQLDDVFTEDAFTIGLHTCGALSVSHFQEAVKHQTKGLLNFGCCYAKMDAAQSANISEFAKENGLEMSTHALTLATRGYSTMTREEYSLKERVKKMRYTLHLFLYHELGLEKFLAVGELNAKQYWNPFSDYAIEKLEYLGIEHSYTKEDLEEYFNSSAVKEKVRKLFLCNFIRWKMGRIVEHYLLTDRCLYLEENGLKVSMMEYFNEKLSPRNIGILALR